jgi:ketosteroid isomerase-like protein
MILAVELRFSVRVARLMRGPLGAHSTIAYFQMTDNKRIVQRYMEGFRTTDRESILSCVTDDVEWTIPGTFVSRGKAAFNDHIVDQGFAGHPVIDVRRLVEEDNVVVAEGTVLATREDGTNLPLVFCDVFEMESGKIRRLTSYLMEAKNPAHGGA